MVKRDPHYGLLLLSSYKSFNRVIHQDQIRDLVFNRDLPIVLKNRFEKQFSFHYVQLLKPSLKEVTEVTTSDTYLTETHRRDELIRH